MISISKTHSSMLTAKAIATQLGKITWIIAMTAKKTVSNQMTGRTALDQDNGTPAPPKKAAKC